MIDPPRETMPVNRRAVIGMTALEACIRLYGNEQRDHHRVLYGQDARASALGWLAMARFTCGDAEAAVAQAKEALEFVRDASQPFLLARGLAGLGFVHVFRREPRDAEQPLTAALALCVEQGFTYFHGVVSAFHGANLVHFGRTAEGVALMQQSVTALRAIGAELLFTLILANLGSGHLALGNVDEGLAAVDDGLECIDRLGERWGEAELHRVRGRLLLRRQPNDIDAAASCFTKALDVARAQQAHAFALRAAMALAELRHRQGNVALARSLLADALSSPAASVDIPDVREAQAMMRAIG